MTYILEDPKEISCYVLYFFLLNCNVLEIYPPCPVSYFFSKKRLCSMTFMFADYVTKDNIDSYRLLGDTENAVKSLTKAVDILRITHGTTTPFMKELLMKLDEARAEASYKLSSKEDE